VRTELTDYVAGPIVVMDFTNNAVITICGDAAVHAVEAWQRRFAASPTEPICMFFSSPWAVDCYIVDDQGTMLHVALNQEDAPRITAAIDGRLTGRPVKPLLAQFQQTLAAPSCP
jgi:hypothetical protein